MSRNDHVLQAEIYLVCIRFLGGVGKKRECLLIACDMPSFASSGLCWICHCWSACRCIHLLGVKVLSVSLQLRFLSKSNLFVRTIAGNHDDSTQNISINSRKNDSNCTQLENEPLETGHTVCVTFVNYLVWHSVASFKKKQLLHHYIVIFLFCIFSTFVWTQSAPLDAVKPSIAIQSSSGSLPSLTCNVPCVMFQTRCCASGRWLCHLYWHLNYYYYILPFSDFTRVDS